MVDTNNRESRKYNITDNEDLNTNYWINGLLAGRFSAQQTLVFIIVFLQ